MRGHIQKIRKQLAFDAWAGVGLQPLAMQAAVLKPEQVDYTKIDVTTVDPNDLVRAMSAQKAGVDRVHSIQSINIPLELGATFFVTGAQSLVGPKMRAQNRPSFSGLKVR